MKKTKLLNSGVSKIIGEMGHTHQLCISDAGFPIPKGMERVDLAVSANVPTLIDTLTAVFSELKVEKAIVASEFKEKNPELYKQVMGLLKDNNVVVVEEVPHVDFKVMSRDSVAVVRSGECSPYGNIILQAGVIF